MNFLCHAGENWKIYPDIYCTALSPHPSYLPSSALLCLLHPLLQHLFPTFLIHQLARLPPSAPFAISLLYLFANFPFVLSPLSLPLYPPHTPCALL